MVDKTPPPALPPPANGRKTIFERAIDNKNTEREKQKSRVILGAAFQCWRQLKDEKGLKADACVAFFLLDR